MAKHKFFESDKYDPLILDLSKWPEVNTDNWDSTMKMIYDRRFRAINLYFKSGMSTIDISNETKIVIPEINRLARRCVGLDKNGQLWGYRALIPNKRINSYNRQIEIPINISDKKNKLPGAFEQLLRTYPQLEELIIRKFFELNKDSIGEPIIQIKFILKSFINLCRELGLTQNDYPLNTKYKGQRSLYRFVEKLANDNFTKAAGRYGENAARRARCTGIGIKSNTLIFTPYERVIFDGHKIDANFTIRHTGLDGREVTEVLERVYLLVIMDYATRMILGYYISLTNGYNSSDILHCIKNSIVPKEPMNFRIPGFKYPKDGGFASIVLPESSWSVWSEFCYDNAKANLSEITRNRLTEFIGCAVNAIPIKMPERQSLIERFFGILEENGYHRLPSTTGRNANDPRKKNSEKKAKKYNISYEDLEELTEVLIADYNGTPHSALNYSTPLEAMSQAIKNETFITKLPEEKRQQLGFFSFKAKRDIKGDVKTGKRAYINFEGVEYRNEILSHSPDLIGTTLELQVDSEDIRSVKAFLPDGSEFGILTASGKWGVIPHSLKLRKAINNLKIKKLIHLTNSDDFIEVYQKYLEKSTTNSKSARNELAKLKRNNSRNELTNKEDVNISYDLKETENVDAQKKEGHDNVIDKREVIVQKTRLNRDTIEMSLFKTLNY